MRLFVAVWCCMVLSGCTAQKSVSERHHYNAEVDSMAVQSVVDRKMQSVREQMLQEMVAKVTQQLTQQTTDEHQKERTTETITMWMDSLGRQVRQEQRTTERDISRQQQLREERMAQEWESRLQTVMDSVGTMWQNRFDSMLVHREVEDSVSNIVTPAAEDNRPWYKRWWSAVKWMLIGAVVCAGLWRVKKITGR